MKYGIRECADVVFRSKSTQKIGKKIFYQHEPVIYFDTLKTSSLEGAATTVYAQGGRGNPRLMSWDGERTVTFTMEDALISPAGLAILTGAGLIDASSSNKVIQHVTERTSDVTVSTSSGTTTVTVKVKKKPFVYDEAAANAQNTIYIMKLNAQGEVDSEPVLGYIASNATPTNGLYSITIADENLMPGTTGDTYTSSVTFSTNETVLVDYYTELTSGASEISIAPDKFGGAFYMEASTLWRDQGTQKDYPAEFIIPNIRIQSNFSFTMSSSGDPSSFTFTCDAFPDYTRFDKTKKVLALIQIIGAETEDEDVYYRVNTPSLDTIDADGVITPSPAIAPNNKPHRTAG